MRFSLRRICIAIFGGTLTSLLLLQSRLMSRSATDDRISMLKRSMLHYKDRNRVNFEEFGQFEEVTDNSYGGGLIYDDNYGDKKRLRPGFVLPREDGKHPRIPKVDNTIKDGLRSEHSPVTKDSLSSKSKKPTVYLRNKKFSPHDHCPEYSQDLIGALNVNASYEPSEEEAIDAAGPVDHGCYKPAWCKSVQSVAIIIPYKNRLRHLITLTHHLHPILQRQAIEYCIIVAEQFDNGAFNKARVMNAAFKEITTNFNHKFDCVIFHDVDMLMEDDRNLYRCTKMPRHLSPAIDKFNYTLGYGTQYGGVTAMTVENYKKVNGHSNNFWGWGGEDNDMENRISQNELFINVSNPKYARYKMIPHDHPWWFSPLFGVGSYLKSSQHWSEKKVDHSGLSDTLYTLRFTKYHKLWTKITLDIRTFLVEKAIVRFKGHDDVGQLEQRSSAFNTEETRMDESTFGKEVTQKCEYYLFTKKTVNKTLGLLSDNRLKYGRMYSDIEKAQSLCDEMQEFCGAIVEEFAGKYSLRATGYMHENRLTFLQGMMDQREVVEIHQTRSVRVKTCPGSSKYLSFFKKPIILKGDANSGPSPAYTIEFRIRLFYNIKKTLYYTSEIMSAYGQTEMDLVNANIKESGAWTTLSMPYNSKLKLLNTSDPRSLLAATGKRTNLKGIIAQSDGIITIKTPLNGFLRRPGCYICQSTLTDEDGIVLMQWKWWFEIRGKTQKIESEIMEKMFRKIKQERHELSVEANRKRQQFLEMREKMKDGNNKAAIIPENVKELIQKESRHLPSET